MSTGLYFILFAIGLQHSSPVRAGYYYCLDGGTREVIISANVFPVDHQVIPREEDQPYSNKILKCSWHFISTVSGERVLLLTGFDTASVDLSRRKLLFRSIRSLISLRSTRIRYRVDFESKCARNASNWNYVELEDLRVLLLSERSKLLIEFEASTPGANLRDVPGLRIQLIEPGFCSKDIPNFDHQCYKIASSRRSMLDEVRAMCLEEGFVQLASFNSSHALQLFVTESQKTQVGTGMSTESKIPLNLTQPVRIGIFIDTWTGTIYYLIKTTKGLQLNKFVGSLQTYHRVQPSSSRIACGSLKVFQEGDTEFIPLVEFRDCREPMRALLSFPDSAGSCLYSCSPSSVLNWLEGHKTSATMSTYMPRTTKPENIASTFQPAPNRPKFNEDSKTKKSEPENCAVYHILFFVMLFLFFAAVLTCAALWRRNRLVLSTKNNIIPSSGQASTSASTRSLFAGKCKDVVWINSPSYNQCPSTSQDSRWEIPTV